MPHQAGIYCLGYSHGMHPNGVTDGPGLEVLAGSPRSGMSWMGPPVVEPPAG